MLPAWLLLLVRDRKNGQHLLSLFSLPGHVRLDVAHNMAHRIHQETTISGKRSEQAVLHIFSSHVIPVLPHELLRIQNTHTNMTYTPHTHRFCLKVITNDGLI